MFSRLMWFVCLSASLSYLSPTAFAQCQNQTCSYNGSCQTCVNLTGYACSIGIGRCSRSCTITACFGPQLSSLTSTTKATSSASPAACRQGTFTEFNKVSSQEATGFTAFNLPTDTVKLKAITVATARAKTENMIEAVPEISNSSSRSVSAYRLGWIAVWKNVGTGLAESTSHAEELMPLPALLAGGKAQVGLRHEIPLFMNSPRPEYVAFFLSEVKFSDGETWTADTEKVRASVTK